MGSWSAPPSSSPAQRRPTGRPYQTRHFLTSGERSRVSSEACSVASVPMAAEHAEQGGRRERRQQAGKRAAFYGNATRRQAGSGEPVITGAPLRAARNGGGWDGHVSIHSQPAPAAWSTWVIGTQPNIVPYAQCRDWMCSTLSHNRSCVAGRSFVHRSRTEDRIRSV